MSSDLAARPRLEQQLPSFASGSSRPIAAAGRNGLTCLCFEGRRIVAATIWEKEE